MRPFAVTFTRPFTFAPSRSEWHELVYASSGVLSVHTVSGSWVVPPHRAVWVPADVERSIEVTAGLALRSLYFAPRVARALPRECCVVNVPPLLRELILHTADIGILNRAIPAHARLIGVLVDQLRQLETMPLQLPQPRDPRARRAAARLTEHPAASLADVGRRAGASARTLQRLFAADTGMSFSKWRERLRLLHALRLLAAGEPVTTIAYELGYAGPSAFTAMFRRAFATTPSRYFSSSPRGSDRGHVTAPSDRRPAASWS